MTSFESTSTPPECECCDLVRFGGYLVDVRRWREMEFVWGRRGRWGEIDG